jgi:hypothetical protein
VAGDPRVLDRLLTEHRAVVEEFARRAAAVAPEQWDVPRAAGKWSPAQQVKHVASAYELFVHELRGGQPARALGSPMQRRISRGVAKPLVFATGRLPGGVKAPREVRPPEHPGTAEELLAELETRVGEFETVVREAAGRADQERVHVTHPYFGELSLVDGVRFCGIHTRHHARFLPST